MAKTILLAEDSASDEWIFRRVLKKNQIENPVMVARDGHEVIAYLEGKGKYADRDQYPLPEILFLDYRMPGLDGFAVLEWLRKNPSIKDGLLIVMLSQFAEPRYIRRAYDLGATSFLAKPFTKEDSDRLVQHFGCYWTRPAMARPGADAGAAPPSLII